MTIDCVGKDSRFYPKTMGLLCCSGNSQAGKRGPMVNLNSAHSVISSSLEVALGCHESMLNGKLSHSGEEKRIQKEFSWAESRFKFS